MNTSVGKANEKVIELVHLEKSFGDNKVLRDINLTVHRGEVISVIGSSGSGKSTMLRCINLLEEPTGGKIFFEGKDITDKELKLTEYRARVGMVFQQFNLYNNMTALENCVKPQMIVLKRPRVEAERIAKSYIERVGMSAYINARPAQLSGGQKQRIAIARAFIKNAPILILDEATSALDNKSEAVVQQAIDNLMKDRTVLVIAHRLSTVRNADCIVVINDGQIVEKGSHEELLKKKGAYAALYRTQLA